MANLVRFPLHVAETLKTCIYMNWYWTYNSEKMSFWAIWSDSLSMLQKHLYTCIYIHRHWTSKLEKTLWQIWSDSLSLWQTHPPTCIYNTSLHTQALDMQLWENDLLGHLVRFPFHVADKPTNTYTGMHASI